MTADTNIFPHMSSSIVGRRHGQALDLQDDYMASRHDANKENAQQHSNGGKDNWPDVEIRVGSNSAGKALHMLVKEEVLHDPQQSAFV